MAQLSDLLDLALPHLTGCPEPLVMGALRRAARKFACDTKMLTETRVIDAIAGESYYPLTSSHPDEEVFAVDAATWGNAPLKPVSPKEVPSGTGTPYAFWFLPTQELVIISTPEADAPEALLASIIRTPTASAETVSDELLHGDNARAITSGALFELLLMPGRAWTNPEMAEYHRKLYMLAMVAQRHLTGIQYRQHSIRTLPANTAFIRR